MQTLLEAARARRGHFRYESGHHGDLWLELDGLVADARASVWCAELARRLGACGAEVVVGPETGGAVVARAVAAARGVAAVAAAREVVDGRPRYRVAEREALRGRRALVVDDAVNAASAVKAVLDDVAGLDVTVVGLGALLVLGDAGPALARGLGVPFVALAAVERRLWPADACPLCAAGDAS